MEGKHLNTPKTGRHTTFTEKSYIVAKRLLQMDEVTKIYADWRRYARPVPRHRIKIKPWSSGLKLCVRGSTSIQDLRVETENPQTVIHFLLGEFPGEVVISRQVFRNFTELWRGS